MRRALRRIHDSASSWWHSKHYLAKMFLAILALWGWAPLLLVIWRYVFLTVPVFFPGMGTWRLWFDQNMETYVFNGSGLHWIWLCIGGLASAGIAVYFWGERHDDTSDGQPIAAASDASPYRDEAVWPSSTDSSPRDYGYGPRLGRTPVPEDANRRQKLGHKVKNRSPHRYHHPVVLSIIAVTAAVSVVLAVLAGIGSVKAIWDGSKDPAKYYDKALTFVVPDVQHPPISISKLFNHNPTGSGVCQLRGPSRDDVPVCIKEGTLPTAGWYGRVSSAFGANNVMKHTSGQQAGVGLYEPSLTYLNADPHRAAVWSGIVDGSGRSQPIDGVAEWNGVENSATECRFQGTDEITSRAITGSKGNNLPNLLNDKYPTFNFTMSDAWGYCEGGPNGRPVVVFPVQKQIPFIAQTLRTADGVVTMHGSPSGDPVFTYYAHVSPGQFPGPVYPASMVAQQRDEMEWAAGRRIMNAYGFGYEPTDSSYQAGNVSEYLLKSRVDGRLYWVTPLTPRRSSSQLFNAYAVMRADQVTAGKLNTLTVYVLADNDPRITNIDLLASNALNYIATVDPGFRTSGGKLVEANPTTGTVWRFFGERNGRVKYRLDFSSDNSVPPVLVDLLPNENGGQTSVNCGAPMSSITTQGLINCLKKFGDELANRSITSGPPPSPSPSPSKN